MSKKLHAGGQRQASGDLGHLLLHAGLDLGFGIGAGGDDQVLEDLRFIRLQQARVDLDAFDLASVCFYIEL